MNLQKTILSLLFFIITSVTVFAQNDIDNQVNDLIQQDNVMLTEKDKSLKLTKDQEVKIREIRKALILLESEAPKSKKKKEEFKKTMKPKRIEAIESIKSLLTPKQLEAYNSYGAK